MSSYYVENLIKVFNLVSGENKDIEKERQIDKTVQQS